MKIQPKPPITCKEFINKCRMVFKNNKKRIKASIIIQSYTRRLLSKMLFFKMKHKNFILNSIKSNGHYIFKYVPVEYLCDKDFIIKAMDDIPYCRRTDDDDRRRAMVIKYIPKHLLFNKEFLIKLLQRTAHTFKWFPNEIKNDKEFIFDLLKDWDPYPLLTYISKELLANKKFILKVLKHTWPYKWIKSLSEDLRCDKEVALMAMRYQEDGGQSLEYFSDEIRNNREIVLEAFKNNEGCYDLINFVGKSLLEDEQLVLMQLTTYHDEEDIFDALENNNSKLLQDKYFMLRAIELVGDFSCYASDQLRGDKDFMFQVMKITLKKELKKELKEELKKELKEEIKEELRKINNEILFISDSDSD